MNMLYLGENCVCQENECMALVVCAGQVQQKWSVVSIVVTIEAIPDNTLWSGKKAFICEPHLSLLTSGESNEARQNI